MRTRELKALKEGARVVVKGTMDDMTFDGEAGVVALNKYGHDVAVKFDAPWTHGWGEGLSYWGFDVDQVRSFNITAEPVKPEPVIAPAPKKRPHGAQEYKGNGKHEWEEVVHPDKDGAGYKTVRLSVPGGWLYRRGPAMAFVAVPSAVGYVV